MTTATFGFVTESHEDGFIAGELVSFSRKIGKLLARELPDVVRAHLNGVKFRHLGIFLHELQKAFGRFCRCRCNHFRRTFTNAAIFDLNDLLDGFGPAASSVASINRHELIVRTENG